MDTVFGSQDQKRFSRFHLRTMFTTGMGVFGDGYGLSSIAIVLPLVLIFVSDGVGFGRDGHRGSLVWINRQQGT